MPVIMRERRNKKTLSLTRRRPSRQKRHRLFRNAKVCPRNTLRSNFAVFNNYKRTWCLCVRVCLSISRSLLSRDEFDREERLRNVSASPRGVQTVAAHKKKC